MGSKQQQQLCKDTVSAQERAGFAFKTVLVTGASSGLGLECCKQLAESGWGRIILACRDKGQGEKAVKELERTRGNRVFEILVFDVESKASCVDVAKNLTCVVDCLVLNAGTMLSRAEALKSSPDGYSTNAALHVLGPITLTDAMLSFGRLASDSTVIHASSEVVRGIKVLGIAPSLLPHDKAEVDKFVAGDWRCKANGKWDDVSEYGTSKLLATLWFSALARKHPQLHVFSVSPGATSTPVNPQPCAPSCTAPVVFQLRSLVGLSQPLQRSADRFVQLANRPSGFYNAWSGTFYASVSNKPTGPMGPQAHFHPILEDESKQEMVFEALEYHARNNAGLNPVVTVVSMREMPVDWSFLQSV